MLQPACRRKFRKEQKGRNTGVATRGAGCRSASSASRPPSAAASPRARSRPPAARSPPHQAWWPHLHPRIFPTSRSPEAGRSAHGQRQGQPEYYVARSCRARCCFEINGVPRQLAREAFTLAAAKLPLRCTFVAPGRHPGEASGVNTPKHLNCAQGRRRPREGKSLTCRRPISACACRRRTQAADQPAAGQDAPRHRARQDHSGRRRRAREVSQPSKTSPRRRTPRTWSAASSATSAPRP